MTGTNLATMHFNQNLVKLLVSQSGGTQKKLFTIIKYFFHVHLFFIARYAAILKNTPNVAMLSLFNIPMSDATRMAQRHSQRILLKIYQHKNIFN